MNATILPLCLYCVYSVVRGLFISLVQKTPEMNVVLVCLKSVFKVFG